MADEKLQLIISARDKFSGVMGRAGASVKGLNANLFSLRNTMVGLAGLTGVGLLAKSIVDLGVEFQHTMTSVKVISGATAAQFKKLEASARLMGKTTEFSATQSADALRFLAMAGLEVQQQIKALPQMLNLATAANMNLARAADISTNIMTQMGLEVEELTRVNDALVAVQNTANTNVEQAAEAFVFAGTKAASFGVSVEELTGMIGMLANSGIRASMAGTTLRQAMMKLMAPSKDGAAILKKYGIEIENADGELRSFTDLVYEMSDAQMSAVEITKLFGARAGQIEVILRKDSSELRNFIDNLKDMKGVARESADEIRDTFQNRFKEIRSIVQENMIKMFTAIEPTLDALVIDFKDVAESVGEWVEANELLIAQKVEKTIKRISLATSALIETFNALPKGAGEAAEFGIIGGLLFGKQAGAVIALMLLSKSALEDVQEVLKDMTAETHEKMPLATQIMLEFWDIMLNGAKNLKRVMRELRGNLLPEDIKGEGRDPSDIFGLGGEVDLSKYDKIPEKVEEIFGAIQGVKDTYDLDFGTLMGPPPDFEAHQTAMNGMADYLTKYRDTLKGDSDAGMFPQMLFGDDDSMTASLDRTKDGMDGFAEYMGEFTEALKPEDMDMDEFPGVVPAMIWGDDEAVEEKAEKWMEILQDWGEQVTDWAATIAAGIRGIFESVSNGIGEAVASAIVYQQNLGDALKALMKSIAADIIKMLVTILVKKMILWAAEQAGLVAKAKVEHTTAYMSTYANTFASWAGAPWPISILAPAMASANLAAVVAGTNAAAGAGAAAHGGLDYVPKEQTYLLDRGERVLSPNQNKDFTDFIRGDGSEGGGGSVTIEKIEILPNATNADAMFSMSTEMWEDIILDRIWPAMDALNRRGIEQTG